MATGNMHRKFGLIWPCGFREVSRQTYQLTHQQQQTHTRHNTPLLYWMTADNDDAERNHIVLCMLAAPSSLELREVQEV